MFDQKAILLTTLLAIQADLAANEMGPTLFSEKGGICVGVEYLTMNVEGTNDFEVAELMRAMFVTWPEYSGDSHFPVPFGNWSASTIYFKAGNLWIGPYGESRLRLLSYMIEQLQAEMVYND